MKVGDKLLCKKSINGTCKIGNYYKIDDIYTFYSKDKNMIVISGTMFSLSKYSAYYIYDFFNTSQEERRIKMQILDLYSKIKTNE